MTNNTVSKGKHGAPLWKTNKLIKATAEKEGKESTISIIKKTKKHQFPYIERLSL